MPDHGIDTADELGDLRIKLEFQARTQTGRDSYGKPTYAWSTTATVWASVTQISGREAANADRLKIVASHVIRTRYFGGATALNRWKWGSRIFNIERVNDVRELNIAYEFYVQEVVNPPR